MKLKALLLALFVAGLTASFAMADNGHGKDGDKGKGKGKSEDRAAALVAGAKDDDDRRSKTATCRPSIELELKGSVASISGASVAVLVTRGGAKGASLAGKQLTLDASAARKPASLKAGDSVKVDARACVDIAAGTVKLVAEKISLRKAEDGKTTSSSTSSSTTTTTTASSTSSTTSTTAAR
jgi:branched-chain amino acid transport system permease protein